MHMPKAPLSLRSQQAETRPENVTTSTNKAKRLNEEQHCHSAQTVYPLLPPQDWKLQRWVAELTSTTSSPPGHLSCQNNSRNHFPRCVTTSASLGATSSGGHWQSGAMGRWTSAGLSAGLPAVLHPVPWDAANLLEDKHPMVAET